jgi:hypothetical protein
MGKIIPRGLNKKGNPMSHDAHDSHDSHDSLAAVEHEFSDSQWRELHREDYLAGSAVVGLMLGIFSIGVVLYSIVVITL